MPGRYSFLPPAARSSWFRVGNFDVNTSSLVAGLSVISMFVYAIDKSLFSWFFLFFERVHGGEIWRLASWPLVNAPDIWIALTIYIFWMLGSQLEDLLGKRRFLSFLAVVTVVPALLISIIALGFRMPALAGAKPEDLVGLARQAGRSANFNIPISGIRFLEIGVFAAFAAEFPEARFFFNLKAKVIAAIIIGLDALRFMGDGLTGYLTMLVLVVIVSFIALKSFGLGTELPGWIPKIALPGFLTKSEYETSSKGKSKKAKGPIAKARAQSRREKSALRVVENDSTLSPMDDVAPHVAAERRRRVDTILDKISLHGMESLTAEEREILQRGGKA
jgi:hypothetical protein